jgi:hypothetical protein
MTTLGEAPGGPQLIESLTNAIKDLSLLYAGTPDDRARPHLESYLNSIETGIVDAVGASKAPTILDGMRRAVMTRKWEIEAGSGSLSTLIVKAQASTRAARSRRILII